jgi:hypothetical protein
MDDTMMRSYIPAKNNSKNQINSVRRAMDVVLGRLRAYLSYLIMPGKWIYIPSKYAFQDILGLKGA